MYRQYWTCANSSQPPSTSNDFYRYYATGSQTIVSCFLFLYGVKYDLQIKHTGQKNCGIILAQEIERGHS